MIMNLKNWWRKYWSKLQKIWKVQEATFPYFEDSGALTSVRENSGGRYFELVLNKDVLIPANAYHEFHTGIRSVRYWGKGGPVLLGVVPAVAAAVEDPLMFIPIRGLFELKIGLLNRAEEVLALVEGDVIVRLYFLETEKRKVELHASG